MASVGQALHQGIDHHVGRSGIECQDLFRLRCRRNDGDVGDAAEVERDASAARVTEDAVVEEGDQRRTGSSGCDIGCAEIGDYRDARAFGNHRAFADLQGVPAVLVVDGLAMAADEFDALEGDAFLTADLPQGCGEAFSDGEVEARDFSGMGRGIGCGEDARAERGGIWMERCATVSIRRPWMSTIATSIASTEVPLMRPATRMVDVREA